MQKTNQAISLGLQSTMHTYQLNLPVALHMVEWHVDPRRLSMQHSKLTAIRLPGESDDALCKISFSLKRWEAPTDENDQQQ